MDKRIWTFLGDGVRLATPFGTTVGPAMLRRVDQPTALALSPRFFHDPQQEFCFVEQGANGGLRSPALQERARRGAALRL